MTDTCVIKNCFMTINGGKRRCQGDGLVDPRCMYNLLASDPEDRESYDSYLDSCADRLSMMEP